MSWKLAFVVALASTLACTACAHQTAADDTPLMAHATAAKQPMVNAVLATAIGTRQNKSGDPVTALAVEPLQAGDIVIPKNARLIGKITLVRGASDADYQSILGMTFDRAIVEGGREISLTAVVRAIALPRGAPKVSETRAAQAQSKSNGSAKSPDQWIGGGRRVMYNSAVAARPSAREIKRKLSKSPGAVGGLNSEGLLIAGSSGVFGLPGLSVNEGVGGQASTTMVSAILRDVRLESGTRMLLVVESPAAHANSTAPGAMP
jgi:hypothetical protein